MPQGLVVDPTAQFSVPATVTNTTIGVNGEDTVSLAGRKIGLRQDPYWLSWEWVVDEWAQLCRNDGADVLLHRHYPSVGKAAEESLSQLDSFVASSDVVVSGLATCGGCTMWTVHDAVRALDNGKPAVIVATEHFVELAQNLSSRAGHPGARIVVMPYPLEGRSEAEVRQIARDKFAELARTLGVRA